MGRSARAVRALATAAVVAALSALAAPAAARASGSQSMWRLYNPYTGEHLYTASADERNRLVELGWDGEGVGWVAPERSETPVFRLYNPYAPGGDHHYTTSVEECMALVDAGWRDEGICWYSDDARGVPVMRQYNPNAGTGTHNYTADAGEAAAIVRAGWRDEGCGWYALARGDVTVTTPAGVTVTGPEGFSGTAQLQRLERAIAAVRDSGHDVGIALRDLRTGRSVSYGADRPRYSASSVKALYCAMVYERHGTVGGNGAAVRDALVNSSNEAYASLVSIYGRAPFASWLDANGAPGAYAPEGSSNYLFISAGECANLWEHIWHCYASGRAGFDELAGYLSQTRYTTMGSLLRRRYVAWCKPGWYPTGGAYVANNETGVVFSDCGPYVMVIMTNYPSAAAEQRELIDALNAVHGALCGGSTASVL